MSTSEKEQYWKLDQLVKSKLFHRKLHEWGLLEIAYEIEAIKGELLDWNKTRLKITEGAWDKVIHRGIKPVSVFAHPDVILKNQKRLSYYRGLAMVSQKSMNQLGLHVYPYEADTRQLDGSIAARISERLNEVISELIEMEKAIDPREFDLWRGMTAGAQAQGSSQNVKGKKAEKIIKNVIEERIINKKLRVKRQSEKTKEFHLNDGRKIVFGNEPDISVQDANNTRVMAIEIKGGIDPAGVLERLGATLKSLSRTKRENPRSTTILIIPNVAMTNTFKKEVKKSGDVDYYFANEELATPTTKREEFFQLLGI